MNDTSIHTKAAELTNLALQAMVEGNMEMVAQIQKQVAELDAQNTLGNRK